MDPAQTEAAVAYIWVSPGVGLSAETQADHIRDHCQARGWAVASELRARRFPELTELAHRVARDDVRRVVMVREALTDLEARFADVWRGVRARIEARGVAVVAI